MTTLEPRRPPQVALERSAEASRLLAEHVAAAQ